MAKIYRYTVDGVGVFQYLKLHSPPDIWQEIKDYYAWLPIPPFDYQPEHRSYFTELGNTRFLKQGGLLFRYVQPALSVREFRPGWIYKDDYQVIYHEPILQ